MADNPASYYGTDVRCVLDADPFFSPVTGIDAVRQDALHRITTDDVLGPGGVGWGYDCRRLLGMKTSRFAGEQARIAQVLTRDERIQGATVTLASTTNAAGLADVSMTITCTTALGPFSLVISSIADLTASLIEGQA